MSQHGLTQRNKTNHHTSNDFEVTIPSLLGKSNIPKESSPVNIVRKGIKINAISYFVKKSGFKRNDLLKAVGVSDRTLHRRTGNAITVLNCEESDKLYSLGAVFKHAVDVFGTEKKAQEWFYSKRPNLGNVSPISICDTIQGLKSVDSTLYKLEYGIFS